MCSNITVFKCNLRSQQEPHTEALQGHKKSLHIARTEDKVGFLYYLLGTALKDNILLALI